MKNPQWKRLLKAFPRTLAGARIAKKLRPLNPREKQPPFICGAFSPDGSMIALSGGGLIPGTPAIWVARLPSFETVAALHGHQGVHGLAWDAKTNLIASASNDYCVVLWDLEQRDHVFVFGGDDEPIAKGKVAFGDGVLYIGESEAFEGLRPRLLRADLASGEVDVVYELAGDEDSRVAITQLAVDPATDAWALAWSDFDDSDRGALVRGRGMKVGKTRKLDRRVRALALSRKDVALDLEPEDERERLAVTFAPNGPRIVAADGEVRTAAWTTRAPVGSPAFIACDGERIFVAGHKGIALLDALSGKLVAKAKPPAWFAP